jgi:hypothetical protein
MPFSPTGLKVNCHARAAPGKMDRSLFVPLGKLGAPPVSLGAISSMQFYHNFGRGGDEE